MSSKTIEYDESLHQWNMTVVNQPSIRGHSNTELSGLSIGTQSWTILGDQGCQSKPQTIKLSLRKMIYDMCNCVIVNSPTQHTAHASTTLFNN